MSLQAILSSHPEMLCRLTSRSIFFALSARKHGELTVSELTQILGQSQPRVSRHLKILADAQLVARHREGAWIFYRAHLAGGSQGPGALTPLLDSLNASDDRVIARDAERLDQCRQARAAIAQEYFDKNAPQWDTVRRFHVAEDEIEARMRAMFGSEKVGLFVDIGTGTGRMLSVFADLYESGVGFDLSREMLAVARANLDKDAIAHAQVRYGDLFALPLEAGSADAVCIHHVLHFLAEPGAAVREAARLLRPGGRLIISDFAPHDQEILREAHAHRRLGFSDEEARRWFDASGLDPVDIHTLNPPAGKAGGIAVKIWLAGAPGGASRSKPSIRAA